VNARRCSVQILPCCEGGKSRESIEHHWASLEGKVRNLTFYIIFIKKHIWSSVS